MKSIAMIAAGALISCTSAVASAGDIYGHIDQVAKDIERQAAVLLRETRHFRHTPQYRHLVRDAVDLARTARHTHITAHVGCNLAHLEADVRELDAKLHHVDDLIRAIDGSSRFGFGHAHCDTRHVHELLHAMTANVHHLVADLRRLRGAAHPYGRQQRVITRKTPPGWGNHGLHDSHRSRFSRGRQHVPGWSNSSWRLRVGF